jgi:hypothetical protein
MEKEEQVEFLCAVHLPDARNRLWTTIDSLSHKDITQVVVVLWTIWFARRKAIHEQAFESPVRFIHSRHLS